MPYGHIKWKTVLTLSLLKSILSINHGKQKKRLSKTTQKELLCIGGDKINRSFLAPINNRLKFIFIIRFQFALILLSGN